MLDAPRGNARTLTASPRRPGPPRRWSSNVISRTGPLLGVIPDDHRDVDTSELLPLIGEFERQSLMRLGALTGGDDASARHRLRHRPSQGRAGHRVRRVSRRALQRRGFHPGRRSRPARSAIVVAARGRRSKAPSTSPPTSRAASFAELAAQILRALPGDRVAVTGTNGKTSNVELTRQLWRMAGHPSASHRHARRHHRRRAGHDRADHARHRHLPLQHGRARADGHHPRRVRGVEPRPVAISHRGAAGPGRGLHQFQPRPSRLSRHDGGLFRGQDAAVRAKWSSPTARR